MAQLDDRLIELENAIISAFPARLQKDPYSKIQFKEGLKEIIYEDGSKTNLETIRFSIKIPTGAIITFDCSLDGKKFRLEVITLKKVYEFKKIKEIVKYLEKMDLNNPKLAC